jgi:hypothetical protein
MGVEKGYKNGVWVDLARISVITMVFLQCRKRKPQMESRDKKKCEENVKTWQSYPHIVFYRFFWVDPGWPESTYLTRDPEGRPGQWPDRILKLWSWQWLTELELFHCDYSTLHATLSSTSMYPGNKGFPIFFFYIYIYILLFFYFLYKKMKPNYSFPANLS